MRHPVAVFVPTLAFLLLLGAPFLHVRFNAPDATILPPEIASRAAFDTLQGKFGEGRFAPLSLAIRTTGPATSAANVSALYDYSRRLAADPRIETVSGLVDVDPRLTRDAVHPPLRGARRSTRSLRLERAGHQHEGRPDDLHPDHAVRAECRPGPRPGG